MAGDKIDGWIVAMWNVKRNIFGQLRYVDHLIGAPQARDAPQELEAGSPHQYRCLTTRLPSPLLCSECGSYILTLPLYALFVEAISDYNPDFTYKKNN